MSVALFILVSVNVHYSLVILILPVFSVDTNPLFPLKCNVLSRVSVLVYA